MKYLQLADDILKIGLLDLLGHDLNHLAADGTDLGRLGVVSLAYLSLGMALGSEANAEETEGVLVSGLDIDECLNHGLQRNKKRQ